MHAQRAASPVVLMGDAAHTAHFSIGSGTKLALEDAIELADCSTAAARRRHRRRARRPTRRERSVEVLKLQNAARNSTEWFENVERYTRLRARAVRLLAAHAQPAHQPREPAPARPRVRRGRRALVRRARRAAARRPAPSPPMFTPFTLRGMTLANRVVVSPMAQYSCVDGMPDDYPPRASRRARAWAAPAWSSPR